MKKVPGLLSTIGICGLIASACAVMFITAGCSSKSSSSTTTPSVTVQTTGSGVQTTTTYTFPSGTVFKEIQTTPDSVGAGITFPRGTDNSGAGDQVNGSTPATGTITEPFVIVETLTTYELWREVYTWATSHGYTFAATGWEGGTDSLVANTAGGNQQPVTNINWRDAMIWCNALTEYYNASGGSPALTWVYCTDTTYATPIRASDYSSTITTTPGTEDNPCVNSSAKGFRLPSSNEFEYAARYRGTDSMNSVGGYTNPYYTTGSSASGATATYTDFAATSAVGWFGDSLVSGTGNTTTTQPVKRKTANALGLYDMNGNVYEWCFDWCTSGSDRVLRGGCFNYGANNMQVGAVFGGVNPGSVNYNVGFRFSRTK